MNTQMRSVIEFPELAAKTVEFLTKHGENFSLSASEATQIVILMRLIHYTAGATLFSVGDKNSSYMLLVLEGNVCVDTGMVKHGNKVDISVLGPSALIGDLALIDGAPRSATCTAATAVIAAGLSAKGFERLMETHPLVAAKLAIQIARTASERLRSLSDQLQMYDQMTATMHQELDQLRLAAKGKM
ncbi:MAG: cyclic nucleotide-binding domain-containing protein [Rhodoferax sp.]|uniref:Crp/Fnr family transcriptional regulator n=1 Tax=Rhodoferax sp. TaxID=50421 RepID=UPI001B4A2F8B|nr:cyclic nucleotide-binding domain-containing protein [Rhodoferax sp.]MBP8287014.1 cyclic nucleotide-binding domain-containing protein [Rhodoferax sp.]MBP9737205.1 cyclic nucleotide-binding domain-containing protein [Rhodoferax sp.]